MSKITKFFNTTRLRTKEGFDAVASFKTEVTMKSKISSSEEAGDFYAKLVAKWFDLEVLKADLEKCLYRFHQNEWRNGDYRVYRIGRFKTILGDEGYYRAVKLYDRSDIKQKLEDAGFNQVGFVTFVNMICYAIFRLSYN